jgi:sec-independent protein translocase protein TatA
MFNLGPMELIIILVIILIFFGSKRLPGLAKSLGQSVKSFKSGLESAETEFHNAAGDSDDKKQIEGSNSETAVKSESKETEKA